MRGMKIHYAACFMAGITVLATSVLNGCGNELADQSVIDLSAESAFNENATNESVPAGDAGQETLESARTEEQGEFWRKQYEAVLKDWTLIENYGDLSYLPMYFDEDYAFDSYWLCDVDQNQVPELFLHERYNGGAYLYRRSDGLSCV